MYWFISVILIFPSVILIFISVILIFTSVILRFPSVILRFANPEIRFKLGKKQKGYSKEMLRILIDILVFLINCIIIMSLLLL